MKKFVDKTKLNIELLYSCFNIKNENIIGAYIDTDYFKIFTKKKRRIKKWL